MQKIYDISSRLTNENPRLKLDKDHVYEIDADKNTVLKLEELQRNEKTTDEEIMSLLLGEDATKEINTMMSSKKSYTANTTIIMITLLAAVNNLPYEVMEGRFQSAIKQQTKEG